MKPSIFKINDKYLFQLNYVDFRQWYQSLPVADRVINKFPMCNMLTSRPDMISQIAHDDPNFIKFYDYAISQDGSIFEALSDEQINKLVMGSSPQATLNNILALIEQRPSLLTSTRLEEFLENNFATFVDSIASNDLTNFSCQDIYIIKSLFKKHEGALDDVYKDRLDNILPRVIPESIEKPVNTFTEADQQQIPGVVLSMLFKDVLANREYIKEKLCAGMTAAVSRKDKQTHKKGDGDLRIQGIHTLYSYMITPQGKLIITPKRKMVKDNKGMKYPPGVRKFSGALKKVELAYEINLNEQPLKISSKAVAWPNIAYDSATDQDVVAALDGINQDYSTSNVADAELCNIRRSDDKFGVFYLMDRKPLDVYTVMKKPSDLSAKQQISQLAPIMAAVIQAQEAGTPIFDLKRENCSSTVGDKDAAMFDVKVDTKRDADGNQTINVNSLTWSPGFSLPPLCEEEPTEPYKQFFDSLLKQPEDKKIQQYISYKEFINSELCPHDVLSTLSTYAVVFMCYETLLIKNENPELQAKLIEDMLYFSQVVADEVNGTPRFGHSIPSLSEYLRYKVNINNSKRSMAEHLGVENIFNPVKGVKSDSSTLRVISGFLSKNYQQCVKSLQRRQLVRSSSRAQFMRALGCPANLPTSVISTRQGGSPDSKNNGPHTPGKSV